MDFFIPTSFVKLSIMISIFLIYMYSRKEFVVNVEEIHPSALDQFLFTKNRLFILMIWMVENSMKLPVVFRKGRSWMYETTDY